MRIAGEIMKIEEPVVKTQAKKRTRKVADPAPASDPASPQS
jgi:hypothetical protein